MFIPSVVILFNKYFNKPIIVLDLPCSTLHACKILRWLEISNLIIKCFNFTYFLTLKLYAKQEYINLIVYVSTKKIKPKAH